MLANWHALANVLITHFSQALTLWRAVVLCVINCRQSSVLDVCQTGSCKVLVKVFFFYCHGRDKDRKTANGKLKNRK